MAEPKIKPEKITKPIQLLGAWLAGLFSIDSCFLLAAANMDTGSWESRALVIAAMANVPLFLVAVFVLQTKFRPELQEDSYYSTYLSQKTNEPISLSKTEARFIRVNQRFDDLEHKLRCELKENENLETPIFNLRFGVNKNLKDKEEIKMKLADFGIQSCSYFGTDKLPNDRTVAISQYLYRQDFNAVIGLAKELGFNFYTTFDNRAEETLEDVLIGAYGDSEFEILSKPA
jgi:hypothetical protein